MIKTNKKRGFTLVELLAVIVILAIILVIAVPKIMNTIKDTTKASFESSAKMVAAQVENQYTAAKTLGKEFLDTGSCKQDWAGLNDTDYATCTYDISDGTAKVTLKGSGKFNGLYVCNGTRSNATATEEGCTSSNTLVAHIQNLYNNETTRTANGLTKDNTVDENIRYSGSNDVVKNYVEFGNDNELWRIIGIFEVDTPNGKEELVKIVREDSIGNMSWDSSDSTTNSGYGVNEWSQADLQSMLNSYYIGTENSTCTYCDNYNQATCTNSCNDTVTPINSTYKSMIETVKWNTGAIDSTDSTIFDGATMTASTTGWYNAERGTVNGKICTSVDYCNDNVYRTTTWEGLVALPYVTDWGYATSESGCHTNMLAGLDETYSTTCKNNNWMHYGTSSANFDDWTWFLSPLANPAYAFSVSVVRGGGLANHDNAYSALRVRPTLYLKSNIQIKGGDGSVGNAYKLN